MFEKIFLSKSSRYYTCNQKFEIKENLFNLEMVWYYDFLLKNNIYLEDVLRWFFTCYLQNEFSCPEMRVYFPTKFLTYNEKCVIIITAFETILKQYSLFVRNNDIDFDLVSISSTPTLFKDIKSQIDDKYVYGNGVEFDKLKLLLFSDQCTLFIEACNNNEKFSCFYEIIQNENIYLSNFKDEKKELINYLVSFDIIFINENGVIKIKDNYYIDILKDLYLNEVINKHNCPLYIQNSINELIEKSLLVEESSLFSRKEVDYLNFVLNCSEFVNGLEIRNKYIHGIQHANMNEEEHKNNYLIFLKLFILLAIKINDEFCIKELCNKNNEI